jgi:YHS domain-containing protein
MTATHTIYVTLITSIIFAPSMAVAQDAAAPGQPPATAAAEVTACAQAQTVADALLANAYARSESARQSNDPAEMRAAIDASQTTIRDVRAQLAACAKPDAADPHAGHAAPAATTPAPPTPAADPHAGHMTTPRPSPAKPAVAPAKPAAPISKPTAPAVKQPALDPHAGHMTTPTEPAPKRSAPSTAKPSTAKPSISKPPAPDPHAGHGAPTTPQSVPDGKVIDPVCGLRVDPADAPSTEHGGQTYHFCSTKHRDLFVSNPAKYLPTKR